MFKFAILADSATDVSREYVERYPIYVVPLSVVYKDRAYLDGIEITAEEVVARLAQEVPTSSLPALALAHDKLRQIKEDGYDSVMIISVSSTLSGTLNALRLAARDFPELNCDFVDTLNIGGGSGLVVTHAARLLGQGLTLEEAIPLARDIVVNTKAFFCFPTLEYLRKGGRIGLISSFVGSALGLRPVVTCNDEGVYDTVAKARGWAKAIGAALDMAVAYKGDTKNYNIAVEHAGAHDAGMEYLAEVKKRLPDYKEAFFNEISSSLALHAGRGFLGVGIQRLPD